MRVNWHDRQSVVNYARQLNCHTDVVVFKHPERTNYNITHKETFTKPEYNCCELVCIIKPHEYKSR